MSPKFRVDFLQLVRHHAVHGAFVSYYNLLNGLLGWRWSKFNYPVLPIRRC